MKSKPKVFSTSKFNLNELPSSRRFEELTFRIFQKRLKDDLNKSFDDAFLMPGVADKGIDILLLRKGKNSGAVQCKMKTTGNINKPEAAKEIIKFGINYYLDNTLIDELDTFQYFFVSSGKFAVSAINLLTDFQNKILKERDLQNWIENVLNNYSSFSDLSFNDIEVPLKKIVSSIRVHPISEIEINTWLNKYPDIESEFFEIRKVIDNKSIEEGIEKVIQVINPDQEKLAKVLIASYYKSALSHLDSVKFIGHHISFNRPRNITVTKLYVEPLFSVKTEIKAAGKPIDTFVRRKKRELRIHDVFRRSRHYIILGDPGGGKSLMVKNIILRIIKKNANLGGLKSYKYHIPFRIELRKYSERKIKGDISIVTYLTNMLGTEYQINGMDEGVVEYIIRNKPTIFFFDGLDEIFDLAQKNIIRDDIINFITVNKRVKCIVTSRFIGYHDVSFPENMFYEFAIQKFNDKQIGKFIEKFYATQIKNKLDKEKEIEGCKRQLKDVDDNLKSNPLILSLMALLAINKIVIPDSKLEVYRSCTNTLVDTRDKDEKQLNIKLMVGSKRGTLGVLAYWQYTQMTLDKRISQTLAKQAIASYLKIRKEYDDVIESEEAAKHFLEYAERRSIYFDNNFMHKTFLEYYTADYIFTRTHANFLIERRDEILSKYIQNPSWHIVFELLIAMIDEQLVDSDVLDKLIEVQLKPNNPEINYFFLGILEKTINISMNLKKRIIKDSIHLIISGKDIKKKIRENHTGKGLVSIMNKLVNAKKYLSYVQEAFNEIEEELTSEKLKIDFYILFYEIIPGEHVKHDYKVKNYNIKNLKTVKVLKNKNLNLFSMDYNHRLRNQVEASTMIMDQIKFFGLESIFELIPFIYEKGTKRIPSFDIYLLDSTFESTDQIEADINNFIKQGLTVYKLKELYRRHFLFGLTEKRQTYKNLINFYLNCDKQEIKDFAKIILLKNKKEYLKSFDEEFKNSRKFSELINEL